MRLSSVATREGERCGKLTVEALPHHVGGDFGGHNFPLLDPVAYLSAFCTIPTPLLSFSLGCRGQFPLAIRLFSCVCR